MFKSIKLKYSIANAELKALLTRCQCGNTSQYGNRVVLTTINKNGFWDYEIKCNYCNEIIYRSKKEGK